MKLLSNNKEHFFQPFLSGVPHSDSKFFFSRSNLIKFGPWKRLRVATTELLLTFVVKVVDVVDGDDLIGGWINFSRIK